MFRSVGLYKLFIFPLIITIKSQSVKRTNRQILLHVLLACINLYSIK
jgi:hypothetical protein